MTQLITSNGSNVWEICCSCAILLPQSLYFFIANCHRVECIIRENLVVLRAIYTQNVVGLFRSDMALKTEQNIVYYKSIIIFFFVLCCSCEVELLLTTLHRCRMQENPLVMFVLLLSCLFRPICFSLLRDYDTQQRVKTGLINSIMFFVCDATCWTSISCVQTLEREKVCTVK